MNLFDDLKMRELVYQTTDVKLSEVLAASPLTLYAGFDPTADSLHVGSLLPLLALVRFQLAGHRPVAVVGGATGMIGDPSGKSAERQLLTSEILEKNLAGIRAVIERIFENAARITGAVGVPRTKPLPAPIVVNNADWFQDFSYIDFLRDVGKHFSVNQMMAKDSVRTRLEDREHGISYTEFSYMLLQAYDFYFLNKKYGCTLQIGGSDQWGNITAGCELTRRMRAASSQPALEMYGLTLPLVVKSDGGKFGKTEKGTVWLSAEKTSPYQFYQFFIQTADSDVLRYLKYFTFLEESELVRLEACVALEPHKREAQLRLAKELTVLVHGESVIEKVKKATEALFSGDFDVFKYESESLLLEIFSEAPCVEIDYTKVDGGMYSFVDAVTDAKLANSRGMARKDIEAGAISFCMVAYQLAKADLQTRVLPDLLLHGKYLILRKGKKNYALLKFNKS